MFNSGGGTSSLFAIGVSFLFAVIPSLTRPVRRDYGVRTHSEAKRRGPPRRFKPSGAPHSSETGLARSHAAGADAHPEFTRASRLGHGIIPKNFDLEWAPIVQVGGILR